MSGRPFQPDELDRPPNDADDAAAQLERYAAIGAADPSRGFEDRVMASLEHEPAPRRGFLGWLLVATGSGSGLGRFARAGALAATLVLAVAGALFAGQLADIVRNVGSGSPTAVPSASPSPAQAVSPSPTPLSSPEPSPSSSAAAPGGAGGSQDESETPGASELETSGPSADESGDVINTP